MPSQPGGTHQPEGLPPGPCRDLGAAGTAGAGLNQTRTQGYGGPQIWGFPGPTLSQATIPMFSPATGNASRKTAVKLNKLQRRHRISILSG